MHWESTDNFGNLSVATSAATCLDTLEPDLESMIEVVFARTPEGVSFSVDADYHEIAAPSGDQVTHIMTVTNMKSLGVAEIQDRLRDVLLRLGKHAEVQGSW